MIAIGRRVYGLGAVMLGAVEARYGAFSPDWLPVPASLPGYHLLVYAAAAGLILGGLAINAPRTAAIGALALAAVFALGMLVLDLPHAMMKPTVWVEWQAVAESAVMALGGVLAYAQVSSDGGAAAGGEVRAARLARAARWAFGACLLVFGVSHFVYAKFTAALVPAWLAPSPIFWTYATGAAQIAAGLAMLSGVLARWAAILLTVMYAVFGVLVHVPGVLAHPARHDTWTENAINLILVGAAWTLAQSLSTATRNARGPTAPSPAAP